MNDVAFSWIDLVVFLVVMASCGAAVGLTVAILRTKKNDKNYQNRTRAVAVDTEIADVSSASSGHQSQNHSKGTGKKTTGRAMNSQTDR